MDNNDTYAFEWKMPLSQYKRCEVGERIWSKSFSSEMYSPLKFYLRVFPHGDAAENSQSISYFIYCEPPNGQTVTLVYNLYVRDEDGKIVGESPWEGQFGPVHQTWGKRRFCDRPKVSVGSDEGKFITFGCKLHVKDFVREDFSAAAQQSDHAQPAVEVADALEHPYQPAEEASFDQEEEEFDPDVFSEDGNESVYAFEMEMPKKKNRPSVPEEEDSSPSIYSNSFGPCHKEEVVPETPSSDVSFVVPETSTMNSKLGFKINVLHKTMELADIDIKVNGEIIKAHKLILFMNSPCFAAMIKQDECIANVTTTINVEGFSTSIVRRALEFMYTGAIKGADDLSMPRKMELHNFATIFAIADLKEYIKEKILDSVDADCACELANLSEVYNDEDVHSAALSFIAKNLQEVKLTEAFKSLSHENAMSILQML